MNKNKQWRLWLAAGFAVVASIFVSVLIFSGSADCPIRRAGFQQLRLGMTEAEVNDLLGVPPGNYTSGTAWCVLDPPASGFISKAPYVEAKREFWSDDQTGVNVVYDHTGKLVAACMCTLSRRPVLHAARRFLVRAFGED